MVFCPTSFKTCLLGKGFHTLINPFWTFPQGFKTRLLREGFHTLINGGLPSKLFKTRMLGEGFHTLINGGLPSVLVGTLSFLLSIGTASKSTPLRGLASLLAHRLVSTSLWGTARRLTRRPVSSSDIICNAPDPMLADIVLFGFFLSGFPSRL